MTDGVQIRVVLIEDHPPTAEGMAMSLFRAGFAVLGSVIGPEGLDHMVRPDLVICDLHLPGVPVRDTVAAVAGRGLRVLATSGYAGRERILDAVEAGAHGFVDKADPTQTMCTAAVEVAGGGCWIGPKLAGYLLADAQVRQLRAGELDAGDFDLLRALAQGDTLQEAAGRLGSDLAGIRAAQLRILDAGRRRRRLLRPSHRELDVIRQIALHGRTQRQAASELGIAPGTIAEYLQSIKDKYLRTHPEAPAGIAPANAAHLWARELGMS